MTEQPNNSPLMPWGTTPVSSTPSSPGRMLGNHVGLSIGIGVLTGVTVGIVTALVMMFVNVSFTDKLLAPFWMGTALTPVGYATALTVLGAKRVGQPWTRADARADISAEVKSRQLSQRILFAIVGMLLWLPLGIVSVLILDGTVDGTETQGAAFVVLVTAFGAWLTSAAYGKMRSEQA